MVETAAIAPSNVPSVATPESSETIPNDIEDVGHGAEAICTQVDSNIRDSIPPQHQETNCKLSF